MMGTEHKSEKKEGRVKKEGWVNVYYYGAGNNGIWPTKEQADAMRDRVATQKPKACVRIEWEEEE